MTTDSGQNQQDICQACGACCDYDAEWPRFSIESEETLARIPEKFVAETLSGMRCEGTRCSALSGKVGHSVACTIYEVRPEVCRACLPGDEACLMARERHGLGPIAGCEAVTARLS